MTCKKRAVSDGLLLAALLTCGLGLIFCGKAVAAAVAAALDLCITVLLPSLYPFFVLSSLLIASGLVQRMTPLLERPMQAVFDLPGSCAAAVLLGAIGGYPVGARTAADLYRQGLCSREDAGRLLRFCNNGGPAFFISALGASLLKDARLGALLYGFHLLSALALSLSPAKNKGSVKAYGITPEPQAAGMEIQVFLQSVTGSFFTFLDVCAFVLFFAVVTCLLHQIPAFSVLCTKLPGSALFWQGMLSGTLELTSGTAALAQAGLSRRVLLPALSFLSGWGGISVQCQSVSILKEAGLPCGGYLKCKLLHGVLAALMTALLCP